MARLNWDRVKMENSMRRRSTENSNDPIRMVKETYESRLEAKGREYVETTSNKLVAEFLGCNPGHASNIRKAVTEKNGWTLLSVRERKSSDRESTPRQIKNKGYLPPATKNWMLVNLLNDWIRAGNDSDDFVPPDEFTPEVLFSIRAVCEETLGWRIRHIENKLGGLNSDLGIALRQWAGRPLTTAQAEIEQAANSNTQLRISIKKYVGKAIENLSEFQGLSNKSSWGSDQRVYRIRHALAELKSVILDLED